MQLTRNRTRRHVITTINYLIDPYFTMFYGKKNFEILTNFTRTRFLRPTRNKREFIGHSKLPKIITSLQNFEILRVIL